MRLFSQSISSEWSLSRFIYRLGFKLFSAVYRFAEVLRFLPRRLLFLAEHIGEGLKWVDARFRNPQATSRLLGGISYWWVEFFLLVLDCLGISEVYELLSDLVKFNSRPLHPWELEIAKSVFGSTIAYHRIRIDESAWIGPPQYHFCYVSFYTINAWGPMNNSLLVHELMHVWQYQNKGIVYIPRALNAMHSKAGYDYGGLACLKEVKAQNGSLFDFNYEQQADIVADYYRIKNGYSPNWGNAIYQDLSVYEYFIGFLQAS